MFQFTGFPLPVLCVRTGVIRHDPYEVFLFGDPRIGACLAAPRGLSQPATSFFGFQRQGIHRVPFATCRDDARARYGILKGRHGSDPAPARTSTREAVRFATDPSPAYRPRRRNTAAFKAAQCAHTQGTAGSRPVITAPERSGPPGGVRVPRNE